VEPAMHRFHRLPASGKLQSLRPPNGACRLYISALEPQAALVSGSSLKPQSTDFTRLVSEFLGVCSCARRAWHCWGSSLVGSVVCRSCMNVQHVRLMGGTAVVYLLHTPHVAACKCESNTHCTVMAMVSVAPPLDAPWCLLSRGDGHWWEYR
jgi:hypothetical protein